MSEFNDKMRQYVFLFLLDTIYTCQAKLEAAVQ